MTGGGNPLQDKQSGTSLLFNRTSEDRLLIRIVGDWKLTNALPASNEVMKEIAAGPVSTEPGACGDIKFYLIEVKFDALKDENERIYFKQLPTSFALPDEEVDKLKDAAHRILTSSQEFQQFLHDLE